MSALANGQGWADKDRSPERATSKGWLANRRAAILHPPLERPFRAWYFPGFPQAVGLG
jgi:hypothetical protein